MEDSVRFIHMADLHLGGAVRGVLEAGGEWPARLQRAPIEAYERAIAAAVDHAVDFVVMAGDMLDSTRPSYGDYLRFFQGLERLDAAGISAYLIAGNDDPCTVWANDVGLLPASAHLLGASGPGFALHRRDGEPLCLLAGRSYPNQSWPSDQDVSQGLTRRDAESALMETEPDARRAPFSVGCIHTSLAFDADRAPADLDQLMAAGMDYWACGHLHERASFPGEWNPRVVFPGCPQGRDIRETGERGCYLVTIGAGSDAAGARKVELEFIPTSSIVFHQLAIDISACQTLADVSRLIQTSLFHENGRMHCDYMVARITLSGNTSLHRFLARAEVLADLRNHVNNAYPNFFCDALLDRTDDEAAFGRTRLSGLFPTVVRDIASEQRQRGDVLVNYAQNELVKRGIAVPDSLGSRIGDHNARAEAIVRDLLSEAGE